VRGGRIVQRHGLYLGEINSSQELAWRKSIEVLDESGEAPRTLALCPDDHCEGVLPDESVVRLRMWQMRPGAATPMGRMLAGAAVVARVGAG